MQKIRNKTREPKGGFLGMLLSTLSPSLLENTLAKRQGQRVIRDGKGTIKAGQGF